ncbi:GNAT family N-acetyltransferase [Treponema ruminis]|uniref:GNAT family N-acetyltransferase n=1 Tax=Treponema ruminis TaxID=744515 RepID=UPI00197DBF16|nr:GNAT family protein [Treponema ruminis]
MLLEMMNNPDIDRWVGNLHLPVSKSMQDNWINNYTNTNSTIRLMIELENGHTLGMVMLQNIDYKNSNAEIGIKINISDKSKRMKNDTDDAYKALLTFAFKELNLNCIYAYVIKGNEHSYNFNLRNGFKESGLLPSKIYTEGEYKDMIVFSILRNDFYSYISD